MMLLIIILIVILILIFINRTRNKRFYQLLEQFPSYPTYPLIGNAYMLFGSFDDIMAKMEEYLSPYDRLVAWMGPIPVLVLKKYDDISMVLNQSQDRDTFHLSDEWLGKGLLTARYEDWKKSRKMLSPAFSSDMLLKYTDVFNKRSSNLVNMLKSVSESGQTVDVLSYAMHTNLETIVENTIGVSIQDSGKIGQDFFDGMHEGLLNVGKRLISPWLHSHYIYLMYLKITKKIKHLKRFQYFPTKVLKDNLNNNSNEQFVTINDANSSKTIIDLLIKRSFKDPDFNKIRMRDELLQIISAGVETSALSLSFLMLMLAIHQDVQQKVYEEIILLVQDDYIITADHLTNHLKYLDQCIKETSRMFSPVTMTTRRIHKEFSLKDNKIMPSGIVVAALLHWANHDTDLYDDAFSWNPDHFSEQAIANRPKGSDSMFGYGPRSCIGAKYAVMSVKTQIVYILRAYHLSTDVEEFTYKDLKIDFCIRSKIGYPVKFANRRKIQKRMDLNP